MSLPEFKWVIALPYCILKVIAILDTPVQTRWSTFNLFWAGRSLFSANQALTCYVIYFKANFGNAHTVSRYLNTWNAENLKCVFLLSLKLLSETFLILKNLRDIISMYTRLHVIYQLFLSDFNGIIIFSTHFWKNSKFHQNPSSLSRGFPCGRADGQRAVAHKRPIRHDTHLTPAVNQ
jgi:hypothetical protein